MVAEDDLVHQVELLTHLTHRFDRQGKVRVSVVAGAVSVAAILQTEPVDLIILDFDMPFGNAADLIAWMVAEKRTTPIITASGWEPNLAVMESLLSVTDIPYRIASKQDVTLGAADADIMAVLNGTFS